MVLVLAGAAAFVYLRLRADLDDSIDAGLRSRADVVATRLASAPDSGAGAASSDDPEEGFVQVVDASGQVVDTAGGAREPVLTPSELDQARVALLVLDRVVPGIEGTARVLARPAGQADGDRVVVVGQSLSDRDEALGNVVASFVVGGLVAVVLASIIGYLLARASLAPVEAMRRSAREVSLHRPGERLPLSPAHDEVRRLGETLNEMLDRLEQSFDRERTFVADASHELRTPIAVVKAELDAALRDGDYGPNVGEALLAAVDECDRLAQLADDLLVLASTAEGGLPVRRQELDPRELLEGVRHRFADRATQHDRRIIVEADTDQRLGADPSRLRQALGNLVDNALRYGRGDIRLSARCVGAEMWLDVADDGPGFESDIAAQAFERFTRGDPARSGGGGAGLGLAIVAAIAHAHDGRVEIVAGQGATVRIALPLDLR